MNQEELEEIFSKKKSREYVYDLLLEQDDGLDMIVEGIKLLEAWCILPNKYKSKEFRRSVLTSMDKQKIVENLFVDILMLKKPATLANMATMLGISLGFQESYQGITLAAEIITVVAKTGFYSLKRTNNKASYYVVPEMVLDYDERIIADRGMYLPPAIEKPLMLKHNRSTPYQTIKGDSLILGGAHNHHDYDISLDALNLQNNIPLCLNEDFINEVEEEATFDLETIKGIETMPVMVARNLIQLQKRNWEMQLEQSFYVYETIYNAGNKFYMPHKVDKRGRIYAQGYHINPMGSGYKKASVDLYHKHKVEIPDNFFGESNESNEI